MKLKQKNWVLGISEFRAKMRGGEGGGGPVGYFLGRTQPTQQPWYSSFGKTWKCNGRTFTHALLKLFWIKKPCLVKFEPFTYLNFLLLMKCWCLPFLPRCTALHLHLPDHAAPQLLSQLADLISSLIKPRGRQGFQDITFTKQSHFGQCFPGQTYKNVKMASFSLAPFYILKSSEN